MDLLSCANITINQLQNFFNHPSMTPDTPVPLTPVACSPSSSVFISLLFLDISCNYLIFYGISCLASFTEHNIFEVHPCCTWHTSFLLLNGILLYGCTTFCLSVHQLMDSWGVPDLGVLQEMLLRTFVFETLYGYMSSVLLCRECNTSHITDVLATL